MTGARLKQRDIGAVSQSTATLVKRQTGIDIAGKAIGLDGGWVRHTLMKHGRGGTGGDRKPVSPRSLAKSHELFNRATKFEAGSPKTGVFGKRFTAKVGRTTILAENGPKRVIIINMWRG